MKTNKTKVIIDTNILVQDFLLESVQAKIFFDRIRNLAVQVCIPEVVIDETVRKYEEKLTERYTNYQNNQKSLSQLLINNKNIISANLNLSITIETEVQNYKNYLIEKLEGANSQFLGYPDTPHKQIVSRALLRKKPFKTDDAGYRDALIWESIKHLNATEKDEIILITNNTKDFCDENKQPHKDLTSELSDSITFQMETSLSAFNERYIKPKLKILEEIKEQLQNEKFKDFNLHQWLNENLEQLLNGYDIGDSLIDPTTKLGRVGHVDLSIEKVKIQQVSELTKHEKLISIDVDCSSFFSVTIGDEYGNDYELYDNADLSISLNLIYNQEKAQITSEELASLDTPHCFVTFG